MESPKENTKQQLQYNTDGGKSKSNAIEVPSISLPKGGGAIKGIDQKFTVNAVNGTAAFSIPLPVAAARGVAPALNLSYNSGAGTGIFGLGWNLSLPSIKRKTDKGLPQYLDYNDADTYLLSEAEDLVPEFERNSDGTFKLTNGEFTILEKDSPDTFWRLRFYKPRVEGLFARIERWTLKASGEIKWRVISKDNNITLYGWTSASRLANPLNALQIYEWFPEMMMDDKGNCAHYLYKPEDALTSTGTSSYLNMLHNRNRYNGTAITYTNLYPDKILYGNKTPYLFGSGFPIDTDFMFQTVFDYGQYDSASPYSLNGTWDFRSDAFSEYKAGFEIRTTRLCKRVLLFHNFSELHTSPVLVKSLQLNYSDNSNAGFTFLNSVISSGYIRLSSGSYSSKSLPATVFTYQAHQWNSTVKEISRENLLHAPTGLSEPYQFTDLYNEGLPGILSEQSGAWFYKRNNGAGNFEAAQQVSPKPSFSGLGDALQLVDLDGDGTKQIVSFNGSPQGYFELSTPLEQTGQAVQGDPDQEWQKFRSFKNLPNINLNDPNARLLDLNGDGKTDVLITEDSVFTWWESDGRNGFKDYHHTSKSSTTLGLAPWFITGEEAGPKLVFAENKQTIHLADMSGDGLVDIVRIRNGEVCYWPNLGYGNFGTKITLDNSPVFDSDADFDPAYIKIADIDGSGTPDLIYLGKNKFSCWLNFSGNSYSTTPFEISGFPQVHKKASITVTDLLGNGLACIVWSSVLQKDAAAPLRYIDLMNSKKPHILIKQVNNMGMEVALEYTPSTNYYIADKLAGAPWATKLHFPVYCISKVITSDKVTGHTFTSNYSYHHGYYDHAEKEFRGFGRVDQTDTESFENWKTTTGTNLVNADLNQAPVLKRSWFHTGAYFRDKKILDQFATEYWHVAYNRNFTPQVFNVETALPPARIIPDNLNAGNLQYVTNINPLETRQAYRACKSMPLRTEVFALDAPLPLVVGSTEHQQQMRPYSVSTHNCMIELLQPAGPNKHAVFCVKESEAITYAYERDSYFATPWLKTDPRIAHTLNLEIDTYGNVLKSASVVYPRLHPDLTLQPTTQAAQNKTAIVFTENTFTNDVNDLATLPNSYRLRLPRETKTYEITGLSKAGAIYTVNEFTNVLSTSGTLSYDQWTHPAGLQKRLIENIQSLYYANDLSVPLALGTLASLAIPYENYQLAYTHNPANNNASNLIYNIFGSLVGNSEMTAGKFHQPASTTDWWIRSGTVQYRKSVEPNDTNAKTRFYTPVSYTDPYGSVTAVEYDSAYKLFIQKTTDALSNVSEVVTFDYRTLSPTEMKDANNNLSVVLLDELGLPKAMALKGKGTEADDLSGFTAETLSTETNAIAAYFALANGDPTDSVALEGSANALLQHASARFVYDFSIQPTVVSTILREEHYAINSASPLQMSFEYSGGTGKVVMKKVQAEPGLAKQILVGTGSITVNTIDTSLLSPPKLRWIGNGRTVVNNKGNAVKQYEPYFSVSAKYENHKELVEQGVTPVLYYDAMSRLTRTEFPDGTFSKVEFDGWKQKLFDQNDTCSTTGNAWYTAMYAFGANTPERDAATKAAAHYNTPKTIYFDTLGRPVTEQETDGTGTFYTHFFLDIESNLRKVVDARGNNVMQYKYDLLGNMVYQNSMDSGQRWLLHNVVGSPLRTWDERNHTLAFFYDALHRPTDVKVSGGDGTTNLNNTVENYVYGEGQANDQQNNLRGNLYQHYDTGGLEQMAAYDFKNNALSTERWLAQDYKNVVDWPNSSLESTSYVIATNFDALGRIKIQTAPDNSVINPVYSKRGILQSEDVQHSNMGQLNPLVTIEYDAKGQRSYVEYGNGTNTEYTYDIKTFRLKRLRTLDSGGAVLQDLKYTYDAVGNITWKQDDNVPRQFYNNAVTIASNKYIYDALYRLIQAEGREKVASATFGTNDNFDDAPFITQHNINDNVPTQNYTQTYLYDAVGNITRLRHVANQGAYSRDYTYSATNNRLDKTQVGTDIYYYAYHAQHGFLTSMPHLPVLKWNFKEEVFATSKQVVNFPDTPETTYYQYDSKGKRLRKITENFTNFGNTPTLKNSRTYIEGYEYFEDFGTGQQASTLSLIDEGHRFVMMDVSHGGGNDYKLLKYQHPNHQSSCTLETDDNGNVITYEEYHPFGTTSYQATNAAIQASAKRYRYTGMERDEETGLSYHNARYYIPWLGRWMNPDPIGIGDGVNVYAYCGNNPVGNSDTRGTQMNNKTQDNGPQLAYFDKFKYDGNFLLDRAKAVPNAATSLVNGIISLANLAIYNTYKRATLGPIGYAAAVADYWKTTEIPAAKEAVKSTVNYFSENSPSQVGKDALNKMSTPEFFEGVLTVAATLAIGGPKGVGKPNLAVKSTSALEAKVPFSGLGKLRGPAVTPGIGEAELISYEQGLASRTYSKFKNVVTGKVDDDATKYLFTIDERGINIALEQTPAATERGFITHTNISSTASAGGEAWFGAEGTVYINPKSARFGGNAYTPEQWSAVTKAWESLGYKVEAAELKLNP